MTSQLTPCPSVSLDPDIADQPSNRSMQGRDSLLLVRRMAPIAPSTRFVRLVDQMAGELTQGEYNGTPEPAHTLLLTVTPMYWGEQ